LIFVSIDSTTPKRTGVIATGGDAVDVLQEEVAEALHLG
jgi:hypothetical protein